MATQTVSALRHGNPQSHQIPSQPRTELKSLQSAAPVAKFHRGQAICSKGGPANSWYCIVSGVGRCYVVSADGRRQIVDLLLPGDFFGFTASDDYDFTVEAVVEGTSIASYSRRRLELLADSDPALAREIRQVAFRALSRLQAHLLTVGRITALEKVSSFILEMTRRSSDSEEDRLVLPVSRYDIADYLAVSVETVSRSLTDLKQRGVIKLSGTRMLRIVNREALDDMEPGGH
jgi:CRP-like cAMP-binding protein